MLAINTAFLDANLALQTEKGVSLKTIDAKAKHSENVLKTIDEMCQELGENINNCLLYTSPSPRDRQKSRMPSSA